MAAFQEVKPTRIAPTLRRHCANRGMVVDQRSTLVRVEVVARLPPTAPIGKRTGRKGTTGIDEHQAGALFDGGQEAPVQRGREVNRMRR